MANSNLLGTGQANLAVTITPDASMRYSVTDRGTSAPTTEGARVAFGSQLGNTAATLAAAYQNWTPGQSIGVASSVESARTGHPYNAPLGSGPTALLTAHAEPNADVVSNGLDVTHVAENAELVNSMVPGPMRVLHAAELYEVPGKHHMAWIKKISGRSSSVSRKDEYLYPNTTNPLQSPFNPATLAFQRGPQAVPQDMNAKVGLHTYALNRYLRERQWELLKTNPKRYFDLTPSEIIRGCDDLEWTGWFCDGSVIGEAVLDGGSSEFDDGYKRDFMRTFSSSLLQPVSRAKNISITRSGRSELADIFQGRGILPGASLWFIVTKKVIRGNDTKVPYNLSLKAGPFSINSGSGNVTRTEVHESLDKIKQWGGGNHPYYSRMVSGFSPFQVFALSVPDGGAPPMVFKEYTDELGHKHYCALHVRFANLFHEPYQYVPLPAITSPTDAAFHPMTDAGESSMRKNIKGVLLQPMKDGYRDCI